jgi:septin family protein
VSASASLSLTRPALVISSTTKTGAFFPVSNLIALQSLIPAAHRSWKPITEDIESRYDSYLEQENRVNRLKIVDNRIHACLYFIQPTGHAYVPLPSLCALMVMVSPRLKPLDIEFMRRLHTKVNLIPVIAKADTLTDEEVADFKARVRI